MMFGKRKARYIDRPLAGRCIPIDQVNDPGFAQKMMGEGFAILPEEDIVRAPITGTLTLMKMAHAFCIKGDDGEEILVHIGIDTVHLKGEGFHFQAQPGQHVEAGMPIIIFDRKAIAQKGYDTCVIVAFSNFDEYTLEKTLFEKDNHVLHYRIK